MSRLAAFAIAAAAAAFPFCSAGAAPWARPASVPVLRNVQFMSPNGLAGTWDVAIAYGGSSCRAMLNLTPSGYPGMAPTFAGAGYLTCPVNNYSAYNTFSLRPSGGPLYILNMTAPGEQSWTGTLTLSGERYLQGWIGPTGREYWAVFTRR